MTFPAVFNLSSLNGSNGFRLDGASSGDRIEGPVASAGDVNGDGYADLIVTKYLGAYVVFGKSSSFAATMTMSSINGSNGFRIDHISNFSSVSSAGDVNGDGFADLIFGDDGGSGSSYVVFGRESGFAATMNLATLDGSNGFRLNGVAANEHSGESVSSAGDVNGDGYDDLIIGARDAHPNGLFSGSTYVVFGKGSGFSPTLGLATLDGSNGFRLDGVAAYDQSGISVSSAGDFNGDGYDDLIVGAYGADPSGSFSGSSYVVFGKGSGFAATMNLAGLNGSNGFRLDGAAANNYSGEAVSRAGDVNGDGFADLIIGARGANPNGLGTGSTYVVFGKGSGLAATMSLATLDGSNGFRLDSENKEYYSNHSVSSAGDINDDGYDDLIVGASAADPNGPYSGSSYVVFGRGSGFAAAMNASSLDGSNGFRLDGVSEYDSSGHFVSSAGDVNGDGFADLIIGAYGADPNGEGTGSSYVVFGGPSAGKFRHPLGDGTITLANDGDGYKIDQRFDAFNASIGSRHLGVDWNGEDGGNTDLGDPVFSIGNATVVAVVSDQTNSTTGFGNYVVLRHELGETRTINGQSVDHIHSLYAHLNSVAALTVGDEIVIGTQIGTLGKSGKTDGVAHLHFEITLGDTLPTSDDGYNPAGAPPDWIDPYAFINGWAISPALNKAPVVSGPGTVSFKTGLTIPASQLFNSANDPDGSVDLIRFYDSTPGAGHFTLNGNPISGGSVAVAPGQLAQVAYVTGSTAGTNDIVIEAFDDEGQHSNDLWVRIEVVAASTNIAPLISGPGAVSFKTGLTIPASQLFKNASDPDGSVSLIRFYDSTPGAGHFTLDGAPITGGSVAVAPGDLARVSYVTGPTAGTNDIAIEAFDGAGANSNDFRVRITVEPGTTNLAPVISGPSKLSFATGQTISASQLYDSATDPDGSVDSITFHDSRPGAGYFTLNGSAITGGSVSVPLYDLWRVKYVTGPASGSNNILIEAFDNEGRASNDLDVKLVIGTGEPAAGGLNALAAYSDATPTSATPQEIVDLARLYIGTPWGAENCTGLLWAVAYQAGARFFDEKPPEKLLVDSSHVKDAGTTLIYDVPGIDDNDKGWDQWDLEYFGTGWFAIVQPGDFVRVHYDGGAVHSFLVSRVEGSGASRQVWVIDNVGPDNSQATVDEYKFDGFYEGGGERTLEKSILKPDRAWVHRLKGNTGILADESETSSWSPEDEVRQLTGGTGPTILGIGIARLSSTSLLIQGVEGKVSIADQTTGALLLKADEFEELAFTGGDVGNHVVVGSLAGTDVAQTTVYLSGGIADDILNATAADKRVVAYGSQGNDQINGGSSGDLIDGGAGNDTLEGGLGNDTLDGGDGNDTLYGETDDDTLTGGLGDDELNGGGGIDTASYTSATAGVTVSLLLTTAQNTGGAGTDTLLDIENLTGSALNDVLTGNGEANSIRAGGGDDTVAAGDGADTLFGWTGNDTLLGESGDDTINASDGDDTLDGGDGNDVLNGGNGIDTASYASATAGVTVSLLLTTAQNTVGAGIDTLAEIENLTGSAHNDSLTGNTGANTIRAGGGDDTVAGGAGADTLFGWTGNDTLLGEGGNDTLNGSDGDDTLDGGPGNDVLIGGNGIDTATYASATAGVTVSLLLTAAQNTVGAGTDTLSTIENLTGSVHNDILTGNGSANSIRGREGDDTIAAGAGADALFGWTGNDTLLGQSGNDSINGGDGDDTLDGGPGNDVLNGGNGIDTASYASATAGVTVNLGLTAAQNTIGAGADTLSAIENLTGSNLADTLTGSSAANTIKGGGGSDVIKGNAGNDILEGGAGADQLTGGLNADRFVLGDAGHSTVALPDQILDFDQAGGDRIDLSAIDAIAGGADDPFTFVAGGAFNSTAGAVIVVNHAAGQFRVEGDMNGDNLPDFALIVTAGIMPTAGGFIL